MSKIIDTKKITDVLKYVNKKTLVIFDVDNTLIETVQSFGSSSWFDHTVGRFQKIGFDPIQSVKKTYAILDPITKFIACKTVELDTLDVINTLRYKKIRTMGATMRWLGIVKKTCIQLHSVNICFDRNTIYHDDVIFDSVSGFTHGILFSAFKGKGECLLKFFKHINYVPDNVVFIDDHYEYVKNVFDAFKSINIPCVGVRYGAADEGVLTFDPEKSEMEVKQVIGESLYKNIFRELL